MSQFLAALSDRTIATLMRTAKRGGARPFFRHPHAMIALREEAARRQEQAK